MVDKKEHSISFSGPMVRAILDGRKTQTRRVIREWGGDENACPYGSHPNNLLWVRESCFLWRTITDGSIILPPDIDRPVFQDDPEWKGVKRDAGLLLEQSNGWVFRSASHMPKWASRLTLRIMDVRAQRVQEISEDDVLAEGLSYWDVAMAEMPRNRDAVGACGIQNVFADLWDSTNGKRAPWASNPWVWAITFERFARGDV
jgi:hypothetical protein